MQPESTSHRPSLECFRSYIVLLARTYWSPRLQGKLDPSDIVQQTLTQAWQGFDDFRGETDAEFRAWLRRILTRCQADFVRGFARDKRRWRESVRSMRWWRIRPRGWRPG